jgi:hypothetical protein
VIIQNCVKVKVTLRPTVSRPVRLGVRRPSGIRDQFFFLEIFFRQLRVCYFVVPSLTRGLVFNLLLLLDLASAVLLWSALSDERSGLSFVSISLWSVSIYIRYLHYLCLTQFRDVYTIYIQGLFQSRLGIADYALVTSSLHYHDIQSCHVAYVSVS